MKALHFGAGNIGRGFIGRVLSESGFNVIFSDINQNIVDAINLNKKYFIKIVGHNQYNMVNVKNLTALNFNDSKIIEIITSVNIITTAAGFLALDKLSVIIAQGIILKIKKESIKPLNIIACENKNQASSLLKQFVLEKLCIEYHDYVEKYIGFVDCSIDTIIPTMNSNKNNLSLISEEFNEWIVNETQFKGIIPNIIGMKLSNNLNPFIARKLLTLNTGHAIAAYLGLIKGYKTIYDAILDKKIRIIVRLAMKESGSFLVKLYNFNKKDHDSYINKIFLRFENIFLSDTLERIGRNPIQKLGPEERLIKPILGSSKYKLSYKNLVKGAAAALHYRNKNDLESIKISSLIKKEGIEKTLIKISNLSKNSQELNSIILEYTSILRTIV